MTIYKFFLLAIFMLVIAGCSNVTEDIGEHDPYGVVYEDVADDVSVTYNQYSSLCIPTMITKIDDDYFIVDCYHDQIIYNDNLDDPLTDWLIMTDDISRGHTVCSDGVVYLADDTENNRVLVYKRDADGFWLSQEFCDIGLRPHYIYYDSEKKTFYCWSSMTGELYEFKDNNGLVELKNIITIEELNGVYVRSFTIDGDNIYFVSGNEQIILYNQKRHAIDEYYNVPADMAGMIQIMPVNEGFYITISTDKFGNQDYATIIYTEALDKLESGEYTDIYSYFVGGGTPYYMGIIDDKYYLTEHRLADYAIWKFDIDDNHMPTNVEKVY